MRITREFVEQNKDKRFTVTFDGGRVLKNIKLFISTNDSICYMIGRQKRRGYLFPIYDTISTMVETTPKKKEYTAIDNAKTILKKIHTNAWDDLKEQMKNVINGNTPEQDFEWHFQGKLRFKNVAKLMSPHYQELLKQAFENKKEFRWSYNTMHHAGRDLSISTEIGTDGKFRAFFSSEYMGCGNGDYWLLLNPTTAIYYERD